MNFHRTHQHYEALRFVEEIDIKSPHHGVVVAATDDVLTSKGDGEFKPFYAFARGTVAAPLFDLLQSAPLLYQQLTKQYISAEALSNLLETIGVDNSSPVVKLLDDMKSSILIVQQCAREGIIKTSQAIDRETAMKGNK